MRKRITPALVLSVIAIVLSLSGGAVAASYITGKQIKDGTITGKDVKNRSLTPADFKGSVRGPQGPAGPSAISQLVRVEVAGTLAAGDINSVTATCPAGTGVVSGGFTSAGADTEVFYSDTLGSTNSWSIGLDNFDASIAADFSAVAYCSASGQAAAPRSVSPDALQDRIAAAVAAQRATHNK